MIAAHELQVRLGNRTVLAGATLRFDRGWTAVVGPNGAGKSTLLRTLAGLLPAAAGSVQLEGRPLTDWPLRARGKRIAWLAQHGDAGGDLSARDVVMLGRLPHTGLFAAPMAADESAVDAAMQLTECGAWQDRRLTALSGGERQRVLLARALAVQAPVLLLDEPTTHLDPPHQAALVRLLRRLGREQVVVSVLHDLPLALHADRVVVLQDGRVCADDTSTSPALHAALERVFENAVQVRRVEGRYVVLPRLDGDGD
ncbi:MAG TPA: ABC transporter ATP-binding protein [Rubrivivax sp.]